MKGRKGKAILLARSALQLVCQVNLHQGILLTDILPASPPLNRSKRPCTRALTSSSHSASPRYQSRYKSSVPRSLGLSSQLDFSTFKFKRTTCSVSENGIASLEESPSIEEISIVKGWFNLFKQNQEGNGPGVGRSHGYFGSGFNKHVFLVSTCLFIVFPSLHEEQGRVGEVEYAVAQVRWLGEVIEDLGQKRLEIELKALHLGQYFLESFYLRAQAYDTSLPS